MQSRAFALLLRIALCPESHGQGRFAYSGQYQRSWHEGQFLVFGNYNAHILNKIKYIVLDFFNTNRVVFESTDKDVRGPLNYMLVDPNQGVMIRDAGLAKQINQKADPLI